MLALFSTRFALAAVVLFLADVTKSAEPIRVVAAGDLHLGAAALPSDPLGAIAPLLVGDFRFVNLEGPLALALPQSGPSSDGTRSGGAIRFAGNPANARWLRGRFNVVSLENNHALDQDEAGRAGTAAVLGSNGVGTVWRRHDFGLDHRGQRFTFLGRSWEDGHYEGADELVDAVAAAKKEGPVVVSLHWGHEGALIPSAEQRAVARRLASAGVTAVLGHGPHTLQGIERIGRAVIAYSLGNLEFRCRCTDVSDAFLLQFDVASDGAPSAITAIPIVAGLGGEEPRGADDAELAKLIEMLSRDLDADATIDHGRVLIR